MNTVFLGNSDHDKKYLFMLMGNDMLCKDDIIAKLESIIFNDRNLIKNIGNYMIQHDNNWVESMNENINYNINFKENISKVLENFCSKKGECYEFNSCF